MLNHFGIFMKPVFNSEPQEKQLIEKPNKFTKLSVLEVSACNALESY